MAGRSRQNPRLTCYVGTTLSSLPRPHGTQVLSEPRNIISAIYLISKKLENISNKSEICWLAKWVMNHGRSLKNLSQEDILV